MQKQYRLFGKIGTFPFTDGPQGKFRGNPKNVFVKHNLYGITFFMHDIIHKLNIMKRMQCLLSFGFLDSSGEVHVYWNMSWWKKQLKASFKSEYFAVLPYLILSTYCHHLWQIMGLEKQAMTWIAAFIYSSPRICIFNHFVLYFLHEILGLFNETHAFSNY